MGDFKRGTGFGAAKRGGYQREGGRPSFGGGRPSFNRKGGNNEDREMFNATCASCQKSCQVPFRPSGDRPVFCRDCFGSNAGPSDDRGRRDDRASSPRFERRESTSSFSSAPSFTPKSPVADSRIDDLKRQLTAMEVKLDQIVQLVSTGASVVALVEKPAQKKVATTSLESDVPVKEKVEKKTVAKKKTASQKK